MNNKNKKYSPLKYNPLRQAGQSLYEKNNDIFEKVFMHLVLIGLIIFMVFNEWVRYYFNSLPNPLGLTFVAIIIITYSGNKIFGYWKEVKKNKLGRDGEEIVGESLEELRGKGYKVFHAIICERADGKRFDIDHVIVGSGGVFTIEVKTISKAIKGNPEILYDGVDIKIDGSIPDRDPISQAKGQMYWLENFITKNAKIKVKVKPVVLYPGWYVKENFVNTDVRVLNPIRFLAYLENERPSLNADQINLIASHIESYIRTYNEKKF